MDMQEFWSGPKFGLVEKKVTREQLFDLSIASEAKRRLESDKPFGNWLYSLLNPSPKGRPGGVAERGVDRL